MPREFRDRTILEISRILKHRPVREHTVKAGGPGLLTPEEDRLIMVSRIFGRRVLFFVSCFFAAVVIVTTATSVPNAAADFTGREILSVTRIAHGGADYAGLQNVTVQASGFVNAAAFGAAGANPLGAMAEVKLRITDFQDKQMRRRLDVAPSAMLPGKTYLVF